MESDRGGAGSRVDMVARLLALGVDALEVVAVVACASDIRY